MVHSLSRIQILEARIVVKVNVWLKGLILIVQFLFSIIVSPHCSNWRFVNLIDIVVYSFIFISCFSLQTPYSRLILIDLSRFMIFVSFFWISDPGCQPADCVNRRVLFDILIKWVISMDKRPRLLFLCLLFSVDKWVIRCWGTSHLLYIPNIYLRNVSLRILVRVFVHVVVYWNVVIFLVVVSGHAGSRFDHVQLCVCSRIRGDTPFLVNFITQEPSIIKVAIIRILKFLSLSLSSLRFLKA